MLYSDWLKIRTQNQVNILPSKRMGGRMLTWSVFSFFRLVMLQLLRAVPLKSCRWSSSSLDKFRERLNVHLESSDHSKYQKLNKLLPRERIFSLLDQDSAFLELSQLAGDRMYKKI